VNAHSIRNAPAAPAAEAVDVRVTLAPDGGWDVSVLQGGRVVTSRHCDDWHRVESLRESLPETLRPAVSRARAKAAIVLALAAAFVVR
jgi:hypothetical protein